MPEPIDPGIAALLSYRPMKYRPRVLIPGHKPYIAGRDFDNMADAMLWAQGFIQRPGTFIKPGSSVECGERLFAVIVNGSGTARLQFVGLKRSPGAGVPPVTVSP